jgi:hypothetical protein
MAVKYTKNKNISFQALQNIPKLGFWHENITSGNPDTEAFF